MKTLTDLIAEFEKRLIADDNYASEVILDFANYLIGRLAKFLGERIPGLQTPQAAFREVGRLIEIYTGSTAIRFDGNVTTTVHKKE